jgi:hypothetical protein
MMATIASALMMLGVAGLPVAYAYGNRWVQTVCGTLTGILWTIGGGLGIVGHYAPNIGCVRYAIDEAPLFMWIVLAVAGVLTFVLHVGIFVETVRARRTSPET